MSSEFEKFVETKTPGVVRIQLAPGVFVMQGKEPLELPLAEALQRNSTGEFTNYAGFRPPPSAAVGGAINSATEGGATKKESEE